MTSLMTPRNRFSWDLNHFSHAKDALDRTTLVQTIVQDLRNPMEEPDGRVVGVYGSWGAGKSHILAQVINSCLDSNQNGGDVHIIPCIFQAWKYETEGDLGPCLVHALLKLPEHPTLKARLPLLDDEKFKQEFRTIAKELLSVILDLSVSVIPGAAAASTTLKGIAKVIEKTGDAAIDSVNKSLNEDDAAIEKVQKKMQQLVDSILKQAEVQFPHRQHRLVIFIDDLDRCSPKNMVRLFEWLKNHLLVKNCVYILGLDHIAAARAIVGEYKSYLSDDESRKLTYGLRYLEKLIDSEYELAPSKHLEKMAILDLYKGKESAETVYGNCTSLEKLAEAITGKQFTGIRLIQPLVALPCLQTPRTMLKIMTKFTRVIEAFSSPQYEEQRNNFDAYTFWVLFLIAMYYRLEPEDFTRFVAGKGEVYQGNGSDEAKAGNTPRAEFLAFSIEYLREESGFRIPQPKVLQVLAQLIHQS
jgi:hypothetical protein